VNLFGRRLMVNEKYLLYFEEEVIALKFNHKKKRMVIGSYAKFRTTIEEVIVNYFRESVPRIKWTQANKVRYDFPLSLEKFTSGVKELKSHGMIIEQVSSHGRLMR